MSAHFTDPKQGSDGKWYVSLKAGNNEIVAVSEGYDDKRRAAAWEDDMVRWVMEAKGLLVEPPAQQRQDGVATPDTVNVKPKT